MSVIFARCAGESESVRKAGREVDLLHIFGPYSSVRAAKVGRVFVRCGRRAGGYVTDPIVGAEPHVEAGSGRGGVEGLIPLRRRERCPE